MKLIKQNIDKDGSGEVTLQPEEPEDMVRAPPTLVMRAYGLTYIPVARIQSDTTCRSPPCNSGAAAHIDKRCRQHEIRAGAGHAHNQSS